jgi:alpha-tubulin suppressor-like RCC1 family protein
VTASSEGKSGTAIVNVGATPVSIVVVTSTPSPFYKGRTAQLGTVLLDEANNPLTERVVQWLSSNSSVVTVSSSGLITAVAPGTATIIAASEGKTGVAQVTVTLAPVASISISPSDVIVLAGTTQQLIATVRDVEGQVVTDRTVRWDTGYPNAQVTNTGVVSVATSAAGGRFQVFAQVEGKSAEAWVTTLAFVRMSVGASHTCASNAAGKTYCWGANGNGTLGDGTSVARDLLAPVSGPQLFQSLSAGDTQSCGITDSGNLYCWGTITGLGQYGFLKLSQPDPTAVTGIPGRVASVSVGYGFGCALDANGAAYCWGSGTGGQLGDGFKGSCNIYGECFAHGSSTPVSVIGGHSFMEVATGNARACAIKTDGSTYCWGSGSNVGGGVENWTTPGPTLLPTDQKFVLIRRGASHGCALNAQGNAYCWGDNTFGQLGDGSTTSASSPVPVTTNLTFTTLALGAFHSCGITSAGLAYCWGANESGQLGTGALSGSESTPKAVIGGYRFSGLRAGGGHTCGLVVETAAAVCWGVNTSGELGDGSRTLRAIPTLVRGYVP